VSEGVRVTTAGPSRTTQLVEPVADLYDLAFSGPPHRWTETEKTRHRAVLPELLSDDASVLVVAEDEAGLVGALYGYPLTDASAWWRGVKGEQLTPEFVEEHPGRTFVISGLAVHPARRREGIGHAVVRHVLTGRPERRAVYSTMPGAVTVHSLIGQRHTKPVGRRSFPPGASIDGLDYYVLELPIMNP
jgi:ribosomal protein S18 acetylase RimI-like enzyme